jgi:hypothetical protein
MRGVAERLGLGYGSLKSIRVSFIVRSATDRTGYRDVKAYDLPCRASGIIATTGSG